MCRWCWWTVLWSFYSMSSKRKRKKRLRLTYSICHTSRASTSQVTEAERRYTVGACSCLQPSRSANNLQTQAVLKPDEQWGDLSEAHRSSYVGDTPGTSWNDLWYTNIFAKLMSWYMKAQSIKGQRVLAGTSTLVVMMDFNCGYDSVTQILRWISWVLISF